MGDFSVVVDALGLSLARLSCFLRYIILEHLLLDFVYRLVVLSNEEVQRTTLWFVHCPYHCNLLLKTQR